jgi:hypothetical protein
MRDVDHWVRNYGENIIFIYGEFDPWTAGEFPLSQSGKDISKYYVPKGNHGAKFTMLKPSDRSEVVDKLSLWLRKKPTLENRFNSFDFNTKSKKTLDDYEFEYRKNHRLF